MSQAKLTSFANREPLEKILKVPAKVQSVYSLTQHVWEGDSEDARLESKKKNLVRLETLDEFYLDPVRNYLNRILEPVSDNTGQGFWIQAEFGVGKSHLLAAAAIMAVGGARAWDRVKEREDSEAKAGPGLRLDSLWRKKIENHRIFPIVFSLEGCGGGDQKKLEDFVLDEAQTTFTLREGKPLAVYPEEHLAALFLKDHQKIFRDELRRFLADERLVRGLPKYTYDELLKALGQAESQRDAGRVLVAFYRHQNLSPNVPTEKGERLSRAIRDILEAGYQGVFVAIDEMSEYLQRSHFLSDDEDCLSTLSNALAKGQGLPIWTLVAAQAKHRNPQKIIGPDRLREEALEHKAERFRDIVVKRVRTITDPDAVAVYYNGYKGLLPWVKNAQKDEFEGSFPFPPEAIDTVRRISTRLTGTRSTIAFLHSALKRSLENHEKDLVPLWKVFNDLMSYNETPSNSPSGAISIRSAFREAVEALESAQATLKKITDGQLKRPENKTRAERILNTLFLSHTSGVAGLTREQILDAVCDLKPGEDQLEAQLGHYETILGEMCSRLRNQVRLRDGRYEFIPKGTSQYDDLVAQAADRLKADRQLFSQYFDRLVNSSDETEPSPFADFASADDGRAVPLTLVWHGQERKGRVMMMDASQTGKIPPDLDTHSTEDDFVVILARRFMKDKDINKFLDRREPPDPRICVWVPAEPDENERAALISAMAHVLVENENQGSTIAKQARQEFRNRAPNAHTTLVSMYARGSARTARTSLEISQVGGIQGAIEQMASKAMDTCYAAREIDFGNRKFDPICAAKLVNGIIKTGKAVGEGDQYWSAVENFAEPLGIVRSEDLKRLDPSDSETYSDIKKRIEDSGVTGLEVRTVYNWFTGYDPKDGKESPGLTRRMVDIYLLCLAQQGFLRIATKKNEWIDRATVGNIEFKPDTLRNLNRIELTKAPEDWPLFSPYLETLLDKPGGSLGPKYEQKTADEALNQFWTDRWIGSDDLVRIESDLRELYTTLGYQKVDERFDDLLLYWLEFSKEPRPDQFEPGEIFDWTRRAVLHSSSLEVPDELTSAHLTTFKENFTSLRELREQFKETSRALLKAAKFGRTPLPSDREFKEIERLQKDVLKELDRVGDLILSRDTVQTRLVPRLAALESEYVPVYLDNLHALYAIDDDLDKTREAVASGGELSVLEQLAEVHEASNSVTQIKAALSAVPPRLHSAVNAEEAVQREVKESASVKDKDSRAFDLARMFHEIAKRRGTLTDLKVIGRAALTRFAGFLQTPHARTLLEKAKHVKAVAEILQSKDADELADKLLLFTKEELETLAKSLTAVLGEKTPKTVELASFIPSAEFIWEKDDIDFVAREFADFLKSAWESGRYLKLQR